MARASEAEFAVQYICKIRVKYPGIGSHKLWHMYRARFGKVESMGRDRFETTMDENGLKVRKQILRARTTDSTQGLKTYPNLVKDFIPTTP